MLKSVIKSTIFILLTFLWFFFENLQLDGDFKFHER